MSKLTVASALGLLLAFVLFTTAGGAADSPVTPPSSGPAKEDADGDKLFDDLELKLAALGDSDSLRVIVMLNRAVTLSTIGTLQAAVGRFDVGHRYTIVPGFAATVTKAQAQALAGQPTVVQVEEDSIVTATNATAQASFGVTKARIDAGVDRRR